VIFGSHVVIFSSDAEADRAFVADVLGFGNVDAGGGWLIFWRPRCGDSPKEAFTVPRSRRLAGDQ
jgi:catechol 2,3-dioxygenase-like lactoylglutathione lyase family enzyme